MSAERLYYSDSFLRRFSARVTAARPASAGGEAGWRLALDRTAFYPASGGQPHDTGMLRAVSPAGAAVELSVESVSEDEDGEVWHAVPAQLVPGTAVAGEIDWDRRIDHMQQHTGQHLLSALFLRELQAPTVSFHLGDSGANIDLACPSLSREALERVELLVNRIIAEDRPVTARVVSRSQAEALLAAGALRKLPGRAGGMRLVEIAHCDCNACGGTHVGSTGQIGGLWLRGTEKISRGVRVGFVCGLRAVRAGRADAAVLGQAMAALSVGAAELPAAIERLKAEARASARERQRLRGELADAEGARMVAAAPICDGWRLIEAACHDRDREFVRLLAARTVAAAPATVALLGTTEPRITLVLARSPGLNLDCGALMKRALAERGLRGGGSADLAQAEVAAAAAPELRSALLASVRAGLQG